MKTRTSTIRILLVLALFLAAITACSSPRTAQAVQKPFYTVASRPPLVVRRLVVVSNNDRPVVLSFLNSSYKVPKGLRELPISNYYGTLPAQVSGIRRSDGQKAYFHFDIHLFKEADYVLVRIPDFDTL